MVASRTTLSSKDYWGLSQKPGRSVWHLTGPNLYDTTRQNRQAHESLKKSLSEAPKWLLWDSSSWNVPVKSNWKSELSPGAQSQLFRSSMFSHVTARMRDQVGRRGVQARRKWTASMKGWWRSSIGMLMLTQGKLGLGYTTRMKG